MSMYQGQVNNVYLGIKITENIYLNYLVQMGSNMHVEGLEEANIFDKS